MRHLGDAVILSGFVRALKRSNPHIEIDLLGLPEMEAVTALFCDFRNYIPINLPLFGHHKKNLKEVLLAFRAMLRVRHSKYDCCINLVGDTRENLIGAIAGAEHNIAPIWEPGHPFNKHIRTIRTHSLIDCGVVIPPELNSVYDSIGYFAVKLGLQPIEWTLESRPSQSTMSQSVVAIHPGASHPSKRWLPDKWKDVIRRLHADGRKVILLGSPSERRDLLETFDKEIRMFSLNAVTECLPLVLESMAKADILVGMDSFSAHAAQAVGLPVVVLHGPYNPTVMTPPCGASLSSGHLCAAFPCFNKPSCLGTEFEYICVRGIDAGDVMNAVNRRLK